MTMKTSGWLCFVALVGASTFGVACTVHEPGGAYPSTGYTSSPPTTAEPAAYGEQAGYAEPTVYAQPVQTDDVVYEEDPTLVSVEPDVWVIRDADQPVYYVDNYYWRYDYDRTAWYRSPSYAGGWSYVQVDVVPRRIVGRDHRHYMHYRGEGAARTQPAPAPRYTAPSYAAPSYAPGAPPLQANVPRLPPLHIGPGARRIPGIAQTPNVAPPSQPNVAPPSQPNVAPPSQPNVAPPSQPNVAPPATQHGIGGGPLPAPTIAKPIVPPIAPPPKAPEPPKQEHPEAPLPPSVQAPPRAEPPKPPPHVQPVSPPPHVQPVSPPPHVQPAAPPPQAAPPAKPNEPPKVKNEPPKAPPAVPPKPSQGDAKKHRHH
jgi:hypothetical protein